MGSRADGATPFRSSSHLRYGSTSSGDASHRPLQAILLLRYRQGHHVQVHQCVLVVERALAPANSPLQPTSRTRALTARVSQLLLSTPAPATRRTTARAYQSLPSWQLGCELTLSGTAGQLARRSAVTCFCEEILSLIAYCRLLLRTMLTRAEVSLPPSLLSRNQPMRFRGTQ